MNDRPDSSGAVRFPSWPWDTRQGWSAATACFAAASVATAGLNSTVSLALALACFVATMIDGPHLRAQPRTCNW